MECSISSLPNEILGSIFSYIYDDLAPVSLTCRCWNSIAKSSDVLAISLKLLSGKSLDLSSLDRSLFMQKKVLRCAQSYIDRQRFLSLDKFLLSPECQSATKANDGLIEMALYLAQRCPFSQAAVATAAHKKLIEAAALHKEASMALATVQKGSPIEKLWGNIDRIARCLEVYPYINLDVPQKAEKKNLLLNCVRSFFRGRRDSAEEQFRSAVIIDLCLTAPFTSTNVVPRKHELDLIPLGHKLWSDKTIVLLAINRSNRIFRSVSKILQDDFDVVFAAVKKHGSSLKFASDRMRNNKEIVLQAIKRSVQPLSYASEWLKNDKEIAHAAVELDGLGLKYLSSALKKDPDIVKKAVANKGKALLFADKKWQNDEKIVLAAIAQNGSSIQFASERLQNHEEMVIAALKTGEYELFSAPKHFKSNKKVALVAVSVNCTAVKYLSKGLKNDPEIISMAIKGNGLMIKYASKRLRNDLKMALEAIHKQGAAMRYISWDLRHDAFNAYEAVRGNPKALFYLPKALQDKVKK